MEVYCKYGLQKAYERQYKAEKNLVHVSNFEGVAGSEDFACATLPTTPLDFQANV